MPRSFAFSTEDVKFWKRNPKLNGISNGGPSPGGGPSPDSGLGTTSAINTLRSGSTEVTVPICYLGAPGRERVPSSHREPPPPTFPFTIHRTQSHGMNPFPTYSAPSVSIPRSRSGANSPALFSPPSESAQSISRPFPRHAIMTSSFRSTQRVTTDNYAKTRHEEEERIMCQETSYDYGGEYTHRRMQNIERPQDAHSYSIHAQPVAHYRFQSGSIELYRRPPPQRLELDEFDKHIQLERWLQSQPEEVREKHQADKFICMLIDERDSIQKKTFTKWVNKHLAKANRHVNDLFEDLRDGFSLIALLEALSGERLQRENGYTRFHRIQNVQYCLDFLRKKNIKLVNIRAEEIVEGNAKLTLGLIWTIILNFQVSQIQRQLLGTADPSRPAQVSDVLAGVESGTSARDALLQWAKKVTAGYPRVNVTNFGSSWRDGLAFNAILHRYRPNLIDWTKISDSSVSNRERLENAFAAAEREFGVTRLIDPEDVDTENPDEKSIITYVSSLYNALPHLPELSKSNTNDLISRLTRGIGITNEKLDLILQRIEDVEARVDTSRPAEIERLVNDIVDDLNALESPINGFFEDVEELKEQGHPEAQDFYKQVFGLHQRRTAYLDRLTNQLLVRLGIRTETLRKENSARLESIRTSTFSRVNECIEWVRERLEKLSEMEFIEDLETLEEMFEQHKLDNRDIQDFRQNVDECIARQAEVSAEDTHDYCELLRILESEYQQLRDLSAGRMLDLDSLIAFVRAAQLELVWVSEREEIEVSRNWSDIKQLDLPMLQNYYKQLLHEMELREKPFNDVHNQGAALLNQGHPAVHVIEVYLRTMQQQWDWLLSLSKCLEEHLRDALNLRSFLEEAQDAEQWMEEQSEMLERNYNRTDFSLEEGERFLRELDEIKEILNKYHSVLLALTERSATISPLWQRGERISRPITVTALCDYSDKQVNIRAGDDVTLLDNGDLIKWTIRDISGQEGQVPSVVFRIPPPDPRLTDMLSRLLQKYEKLRKLWDKKHRMVRFYMVLNTMKTIQGWDLDTFNKIDPDQRDAIMKALNDDANKLLSELDPNDPLALRLKEELRLTNEHFWNLLNQSQKPPEPDYASQYDQKIADLLRKLEEAWRKLNDRVNRPVARTPEEMEQAIIEHKEFEDALQALDAEVGNVKELFRQLPNPTPTQRVNNDKMGVLWENLWDLSRMYVERIKVLEAVLNGMIEVGDIVRAHEITLNSFDDMPSALEKLRGVHSQLLEMNMVLQQQQTVIDTLNKNVAALRQHVARTRIDSPNHPDVDRIEEEVQQLNVRWENVGAQVAERLKATERALQIQMVFRSEYENEMAWLDRVEDTINKLRKPEELRPEEYQKQLDLLVAEYAQLQERTEAIENVNREGGKFIRDAKNYDLRLGQFGDNVVRIHGHGIRKEFRRSEPQPKNGAQIVTEELEALNRRFAQLSSLILERRNVMQVLIQNWKRQKQEDAVQAAVARQRELSAAIDELGQFEEVVYKQHLSISLDPSKSKDTSSSLQAVKESVDSWAERVREQLAHVDRLCAEQADSLPPEQFALLRQQREQLAANYDVTVRNVELVYARLDEMTRLLIEFSSETSSAQSWITDATRRAGAIRMASLQSQNLNAERERTKALQEEVSEGDARLKRIANIVSKIDAEMSLMLETIPSIQLAGMNSDEVTRALYRVQDDYDELLKLLQDLTAFQVKLGGLHSDVTEHSETAHFWLSQLEHKVADLGEKNAGAEEKIGAAEQLRLTVAGEQYRLEHAEEAEQKLIGALEGTPASEETKRKLERDRSERRKRHEKLLERIQDTVNEAEAEKARQAGLKSAIESLCDWTAAWEKKLGELPDMPLKEDDLSNLKVEQQTLRAEADAKIALIDQLADQVKDVDSTHQAELNTMLATAQRRLSKGNVLLRGYGDNLNDALNGVKELGLACDDVDKACDQLSAQIAQTAPQDSDRIAAAVSTMQSIGARMANAEQLANRLFSIPGISAVDQWDARMSRTGEKVDSVAEQLDLKKQAGEGVEKMEQQVDADRARLSVWLEAAEKRLSEFAPAACTSAQLEKQIDESRGVKEELQTGAALLKELEELTEQIAMATQTPGSRASVIPRNVVDLAARFNRVDAAVEDRNAHLVDKYKKVVDFEADAENMKETVAQLNAKVSGLPIDATKEGLQSAQDAIEGVEKQVRADQRKLQQLKIEASDIVRHSSNRAPEVVEKEREIETEWEQLQSDIDRAKKDIVLADKLADGATQHERWLAGKQQLLDAIGKPSTDPAAARAQAGQIHMIKIDAENEEPNLARLESLAGEIANRISNEEDKEKLLDKVSNLRRHYASFDGDVRNKEADLDKAAKLGAEISKLGKKIKHELGDLEQKVETASRLPPSEVDEQLQTLERLLDDTGRVNDLVDELTAAAKEAEELGVDDGCRRDIDEALIKAKNRSRELERKVASVKAASQNAREKGEAVEHALDRLLMAVDDAALFVNSAPPLCADPSKIEEQSAEFEKFYGDLLAKEGEVSLVRGKFADIRMSNPKPELVEKFDRLNVAWTPLLQKTKEMKNTLDGVKDLVGQFVDAEEELKKEVTAHEGNMQKAVEGGSNAEQLANLLYANDAHDKKSDALNALARRIEELAPGPDSRHLKRRAENLHDDLSLHGKKAKAAVERAKRKTDVGAKLARQLDTAEDGLKEKAGLVEQLSADKQLSRDKLKSKQWELESWRDRTERDLNQLIDELVECGDEAEAAKTTERKESILDECDALLEELRKVDDKLQKDAEESGQMKSQGDSLSQKAHTLFTDIVDMDPVGLSTIELEKQKDDVASLEETLDDCSRELDALREDWEQAAQAGKCTPIQHAGALQQIADARRVIDKGRKKLGDRKKRISTAEAERDKLCKDAVDVLEEVTNVSSSDVLQPGSDLTAAQQAQALADVKEKMRVIGAKVDGLNSDCKAVIRGAAPGADSSQVADVAAEVSGAWTALQNAVAVKQNEIDAAVQQMGSYQDAYKSLLNWLEETEELISNQKPPSSDSNVARAQLQGYDVILKHIEDKQTSVDGFSSMMDKLSEVTSSEAEKKALHGKADQISTRYNELLGDAQRKQARLRDTVDLAEKFANAIEPVETWIADADKRLVKLGKLPTSSEKLNVQLADVAALLEELQDKDAELDSLSQAGNALAAVAGVGDSSAVQQRLTSAITKHDQLEKRAEQCKQCLADMAEQVADFEQDANFLAQWLDQMEHDMMSVEELPINPEELLEQTNLLSELVEAVTERDLLVSNIGAVGKTLCSATSAQEALELQNKVEGLKTRYMDLAAYADEKLVLLTKAIPLSERFHDGIEAVMEWVEAVEDDLRAIDSVDLDTQQQLISAIEEDVTQWRPEVDELVAVSSQLQQLAGAERADELHQHTHEMSRRVAQIADQIGRRAERLQMTERQSRDVVDELDFVLEWLGDARERIMQAPPLAIHPEYLKTQLRNQKLLNEDLGIQKARLRDATAECRKVARQIGSGGGHDTALLQKAEVARELVDEVASMCADRTEMLEQGVVLAEQIGASFEDMNEWLQEVEDELAVQPPVTTATPPNQLAQQQQHNMELSAVIAAQRPLIERFQKDVSALVQLVEQEDAACLDQISEQIVGRFHDIQDMVKARGEGIDSILDATEAFGDRLEVLLVSLEGAAESLRQPAAVSADPGLLQSRIAENEALVDSLREKGDALNAMKERAANLLRDATPGDPAAAEVAAKVQALGQLWDEITEGAQMRGMLLNDALAKANRFWSELEGCQKALDTLKAKLDSVEPAIGQPERIGEQKRELEDIGEEVDRTVPMINGLKHASAQLSAVIPPEEKPAVEQQVDLINQGWETITQLFADKNHNLGRAMDEAMQFHDDLSALHEYLEGAEATLNAIPDPQGETVESVRPVLEKLCAFRAEIDDHALLKEQLNQKASALTAGCTPHQTAAVRAPVAQLNQRWNDLYAAISQKEHKMERALMEMGRLGEAIDQLISWETRTEETIGELSASTPTNLRQIEILQCKVAVVANDVHAHESSVQSVNAAAARLLKKEGAEAQGGTQAQLAILNSKWKLINDSLAGITHKLDGAKSAAEDVGGEMERWLAYVEDAEAQLATVKPSGGLPETAQTHLDDFHVLKAEIEQNTPALEAHLRTTEQYLAEHAGDEGSWIGRSEQALRQKWKRCKDLVVDREKKLVLALEEAIQLERSMRETGDWLELVEDALGTAPPIGRLPDTLKTQKEQHAGLAEEVQQRKALVSEMQSTGTRMQYYCEKKDAIPIKNGLVSLRHRFEKVVARVNERGKHLDAAASETDQWLNGWSELTFWLDEAGLRQGADLHDGQSVKQHLDDAKALLDEMHSKNPLLDQTLKRGKALSEHAPKGERKQIEAKNNELRDRWRELEKTVAETKRQAEDAVLESSAFGDATAELEAWIDAELLDAEAAEDSQTRVYGDIDTVHGLVENEKKRAAERAVKKRGLDKVLEKAAELLSKDVDEKDDVEASKKRLEDKWQRVEHAAKARDAIIKDAVDQAETFDHKAHALLDWLAQKEREINKAAQTPDVDSAIAGIGEVQKALATERPRRDDALALGSELLEKAHPLAEQPLKHWNRVVAARWKEVEERAAEKVSGLSEAKAAREERDAAIRELLAFVAQKRDELNAMTSAPVPDNLTAVADLQRQFEQLDFDLTERQPDVDKVIRGANAKKDKHTKAGELADQWKQLWLDAIGHKNALDDAKDVLEEMKRLEGWTWEDWKERYVEWNDHGKARVTDLFRRIDRSGAGNVPTPVFIDAVINSKFPTSRLEMQKVAALFDKDGFVNSKDFINALRFDKSRKPEPKTEQEKINEEMSRQVKQCSCCSAYKIEKVSDGHYRFGDTQIKRMVRILRSTVMVRVGGGWEALDEFLQKHDPCRAKGRLNINMFYNDVRPLNAVDTMRAFTKGRHVKVPAAGTPGPVMKIREKTERSMPMFPGASSSRLPVRSPSDASLSGKGTVSQSGSRASLLDGGSRPPSRASESTPERQTRIPSLRGKKGARYNPPRQL